MAKYRQCPNCRNEETGFDIWQCKHCGGMWCSKLGFFSHEGCGPRGDKCLHCNREIEVPLIGPSDLRELGEIE